MSKDIQVGDMVFQAARFWNIVCDFDMPIVFEIRVSAIHDGYITGINLTTDEECACLLHQVHQERWMAQHSQ